MSIQLSGNRSAMRYEMVYTAGAHNEKNIGTPGEFPFTRGIYASMYRGQGWSKRQLIGLDTAESFNERQLELIAAGQTAVNLTTCNSTYRGLDIDEVPFALIGTCGTPINCQEDIAIAFRSMNLSELSFGLNDPTPFTIAARLLVFAEEQGVSWTAIRGTSNQSDFLSHFVANHMFLRLPPRGALRVLVDHVRFMSDHVPGWNPVSVVGQHMQQAGASPVQALAFTLCTAMEYVRAVRDSGLSVDAFGRRVTFFHDISMSFFEEIAKLRAQRRMWSTIMRDRFAAADERTWKFKVHTQTSGADLTQAEPLNNIVRVSVQALAAVLGGTQSLHTDAYDEAFATPSSESARLALMTQHIIADETDVAHTVDPLGGSYFVEALTDEVEAQAWTIINEIEKRGGMLQACDEGYVQAEIGATSWKFQSEIERGERVVVGVNRYSLAADDGAPRLDVQRVDHERVRQQLNRVVKSRSNRDQVAATAARQRIADLGRNVSDNAFASVLDGVRAGLSHGEIVSATRSAFGFGKPVGVI